MGYRGEAIDHPRSAQRRHGTTSRRSASSPTASSKTV
jgi:hypothetical protein